MLFPIWYNFLKYETSVSDLEYKDIIIVFKSLLLLSLTGGKDY